MQSKQILKTENIKKSTKILEKPEKPVKPGKTS
jgi:hypothetical protein